VRQLIKGTATDMCMAANDSRLCASSARLQRVCDAALVSAPSMIGLVAEVRSAAGLATNTTPAATSRSVPGRGVGFNDIAILWRSSEPLSIFRQMPPSKWMFQGDTKICACRWRRVRSQYLRRAVISRRFATVALRKGAASDLSDAELGTADRHPSVRQLPTNAKCARKQPISKVQKRRAEQTKPAGSSE
jgi:hypothetical protein